MNRMTWSRQMILLQTQCRQAEQAARDAASNFTYSPGSVTMVQVEKLNAAARAAQDAVRAHHLVKAEG